MKLKSIRASERDLEAVKMRRLGFSYRDIANSLKCSVGTAHNAVKTALESNQVLTTKEADLIRELELERLDRMFVPVYQQAIAGDYKAVEVALRIMERRSKYLGLDHKQGYAMMERLEIQFIPADGYLDEEEGVYDGF